MTTCSLLCSRRGWALGLALVAACSNSGASDPSAPPDAQSGPAFLAFYGASATVDLPASARLGDTVLVRFTTFLGGCLDRGPTTVTLTAMLAEIRPTRRARPDLAPDPACAAVLAATPNVVPVVFTTPGTARILVVGRAEPGDRPLLVERQVLVTP
jgi:hypothetical protein